MNRGCPGTLVWSLGTMSSSRPRFENPRQLRSYDEMCPSTAAYASAIAAGRPGEAAEIRQRAPSELSPIEHRQCVDMLTAGQRSDLTFPELLARLDEAFTGMSDIRLAVIGPTIEWWDLVDRTGRHRFRVWFYGVDSGVVFGLDDLERFASFCQGSLDVDEILASADAATLWFTLRDAHERSAREHPSSELATREVPAELICRACNTRVAARSREASEGCPKCAPGVEAIVALNSSGSRSRTGTVVNE